jgi:hypothetical protein
MTFSLLRRCGDFISYANNCYAVYPIIRAVMQADSCNEFMQNTVMQITDTLTSGHVSVSAKFNTEFVLNLHYTTFTFYN